MKAQTSSRTAEFVAFFRALETAQPKHRFFEDPLAASMLPLELRVPATLARLPGVRSALTSYVDSRWPCTRSSAVARTRFIDDLVREALAAGTRQLVVLGAGFDTRAYRLDEAASVVTFEVDHPATQALKRRRLRAGIGSLPDGVRFVPVDFEVDDLARALLDAGFDPHERSMVLWEGVVSYLSSERVDHNFATLRGLLAPQSRLVFTYVHRGAIDGSVDFAEAKPWKAVVKGSGEPFIFGFDPLALGAYLGERGFALASDEPTSSAAEAYNVVLDRSERGSELYRIAVADRTAAR